MGRRTSVEVPLGGTGRLLLSAGCLQRRVERTGVEDVGRVGRGRHSLLWLEQRPRAQDAGAGSTKRHWPCLDHALPWVVARGPWREGVVGGVGVGTGAAAGIVPAATIAATAIVAVVGTIAAAVVVPGAEQESRRRHPWG